MQIAKPDGWKAEQRRREGAKVLNHGWSWEFQPQKTQRGGAANKVKEFSPLIQSDR
jgi:hypothetical protein